MNKNELLAQRYTRAGYRRVSNKYLQISRVDQKHWVKVILKSHDFGQLTPENVQNYWADNYRRCRSNDVIQVNTEVFKLIPTSCGDNTGYVVGGKEIKLYASEDQLPPENDKPSSDFVKAVQKVVNDMIGEIRFTEPKKPLTFGDLAEGDKFTYKNSATLVKRLSLALNYTKGSFFEPGYHMPVTLVEDK